MVLSQASRVITGPRTVSAFKEKGMLNESEFVSAGDNFVPKCPTWSREVGEPSKRKSPGTVIGLSDVLIAGDKFEVVDSLDVARQRAVSCTISLRDAQISAKAREGKVTLSSIDFTVSAGKQSGLDKHQLNIILKVDLQVDFLSDEVDTLLSLLGKMYITLDHYSPVL